MEVVDVDVDVPGEVRVPKLLFVEDEWLIGAPVMQLAAEGQAEVVWARNPEEAFEAYDAHDGSLDAIVLDGNLGRKTSVAFAEHVNATGYTGRRIRTTGNAQLAKQLDDLGFKTECAKPYLPNDLLLLVAA